MDFSKTLETFLGNYIAAAAIIAVGVGMLIWRIATSIKGMRDKVDGIKDLPCKDHASHISHHSEHIANTEKHLGSLEGKLDLLVKLLPQVTSSRKENILSDDMPVLSQKNSPKMLNDNGRIVERIFGCKAFISSNSQWLLDEVAKFNPKTALDVEIYSFAALRVASLDDRFNDIKNQIYNSPAIELKVKDGETQKFEITLDDVLFVLSLSLRDLYLERHPEIFPE